MTKRTYDETSMNASLALLKRGLITMSEASHLAGVSRQLMRHWAREVPGKRNREAVLARLWSRELTRRR